MSNTSIKQRVVIIVSGGMDSCVLAHYYAAAGFDMHLVSFAYGQRHIKELTYADRYISHMRTRFPTLDIRRSVIELPIATLLSQSDSALINSAVQMPYGHYTDDSMKATVVPFRNPNMLLQAATIAWNEDATFIAYAAHQGDHAQYPDCRQVFVEAFNSMLATAMDEKQLHVEAPFLHMTKAHIARLGASLGVPFEKTWSCYEGGHDGCGDKHCGRCGTCTERYESFQKAGIPDPTAYVYNPATYLFHTGHRFSAPENI